MNPYWQPIETAPKDGTELLIVTSDGKYYAAFWHLAHKRWTNQDGFMVLPTHWIPLQLAVTAPALLGVVKWAMNDADSEILGQEWSDAALVTVKKATKKRMLRYQ